ncbi:MAG TPA: DnaJ domain-containing protein [Roseiflexaceae bacterium]|nr:DnaJ domain-containing protein [Roseiflexaceae bacterium]
MAQDYYELLQVHPRAEPAAIQAAYERLQKQYDPVRLEGAADELIEIARRKRTQIDTAYAVLSDEAQRQVYDAALAAPAASTVDSVAASDDVLDYRPLPPAGRAERPRRFNAEPATSVVPGRARILGMPLPLLVILVLVLGIGLTSMLITGGLKSQPAAEPLAAAPTATVSPLDGYEAMIAQAKAAAEQNPNDANAWITYANSLYDSVQIVRENAPASTLYQERLPRWLEASQAYERALSLQPDNAIVLADKGVSLCYYGAGSSKQSFVEQGLTDVREAASVLPDNVMIQLNLGDCLMSTVPPQTNAAIDTWKRVIELAPADSDVAKRAQDLIQANNPNR